MIRMAVVMALVSLIGVIACSRGGTPDVPAGAIVLGETTVADVNGLRVGSGNYFKGTAGSGGKRSIQVAIWDPDGPQGVRSMTLYEGDEVDIGGARYRLHRVDTGTGGDTGKAYLVPLHWKRKN